MRIIGAVLTIGMLLWAGCSGLDNAAPNGEQLLSEANSCFAKASAAVKDRDFARAKEAYERGMSLLRSEPALVVAGRKLEEHAKAAAGEIARFLDADVEGLLDEAAKKRQQLSLLQALVRPFGSPSIKERLAGQTPILEAKFEREEALAQASTYDFWVSQYADDFPPDVKGFPQQALKILQEKMAPLKVRLLQKRPEGPLVCAGTIHLLLSWKQVSYSSGPTVQHMPSPLDSVPSEVQAELVIDSQFAPTPLDGRHCWSAKAETPAEIQGFGGTSMLRDTNREKLLTKIRRELAKLPNVPDGEALVKKLRDAMERSQNEPFWTYTVTSHTTSNQEFAPNYDYSTNINAILSALADRLGSSRLVPEKTARTPGLGTVTINVAVAQIAYGEKTHGMQTVSQALPKSMLVIIAVRPANGACSWPTPKSFSATIDVPEQVERSQSASLIQQSIAKLADDIAAQIRREPKVNVTSPDASSDTR